MIISPCSVTSEASYKIWNDLGNSINEENMLRRKLNIISIAFYAVTIHHSLNSSLILSKHLTLTELETRIAFYTEQEIVFFLSDIIWQCAS